MKANHLMQEQHKTPMEANHLTQEQHKRLHQALAPFHCQYDAPAKLLKEPYTPHRFLTVFRGLPLHPTRSSTEYALALLGTGTQEFCDRAAAILEQVIHLQIQKATEVHYGNWPKYWEERTFKVLRPDPNWANFISTYLLEVVLFYRNNLSPELLSKINLAILKAAEAIQYRGVNLDYTNIAASSIYVTLIAGQFYEDTTLYKYGMEYLRSFHAYVLQETTFSEYNSPNYQVLTLKILGRLRRDLNNAGAKQLVEDLYHLAWQDIAHHFHPPTQQWAGPHSRSYSSLLKPEILALIERSTSEQVQFGVSDSHPSIDEHLLPLPCPPSLEKFFISSNRARTLVQTLCNNHRNLTLTTYLSPEFTLGTSSQSDFWHQRHLLVAYWGTAKHPNYLRLRLLYDNKDFASAQFFSVQSEGNVLAGINFALDIDKDNPYVDRQKAQPIQFFAKDLRLRFEFGGTVQFDQLNLSGNIALPLQLQLGGLYFNILFPYARFGNKPGKLEIREKASGVDVDLVLYSGIRKLIRLANLSEAAIGVALQISNTKAQPPNVLVANYENWLEMEWKNMKLKFLKKPSSQKFLIEAANQSMKAKTNFLSYE